MAYRILHVLNNLGSGGVEMFLMNIYRKIDRSKVQFDFLIRSGQNGPYVDEILALGGRIYQISEFPRHGVKNYCELNNFFKMHNEYKIVHVHANSLIYIKPLQLAKKNGVPCRIIHSHNTGTAKVLFAKAVHKYNKMRIGKYVTNKFACSSLAGEWMFLERDFQVIFNGVDIERFLFRKESREHIRQKYKIADEIVVGHVGRFVEQKNHRFLIKIFYQYQKRNPASKLMLIGTGEEEHKIRTLVESLGISEKVIFVGVVNNVQDYLCAMDVFVFPSFFEGLGIVLIEAQISGLPCIVSDVVPREAIIRSNCRTLSLSSGISQWERMIEESRRDWMPCDDLKKYDSKSVASMLEAFYVAMSKEGGSDG